MNLPKPQRATSVDASAVFSKIAADEKDWAERTTQRHWTGQPCGAIYSGNL